ncbi:MAG: UvrD-helicase domain-containing protein [Solirubrobacterales bacterium]
MNPTTQQQAVIDSDAPDILVEAGAGSGKTTTTVERYIRLLSKPVDPYEPSQILAFTFTDKAAGELREKVRQARRRLLEQTEGSNPQAFSMSTAWVGTFHAICTRILKAYPVEAGVDPGFSVVDDVMSETIRNEAFSQALAEFQREDTSGGRRESMIGLYRESTIRETTMSAYDELRSRGFDQPRLPDFADTEYPVDGIAYLRANVSAAAAEPKIDRRHKPKAEDLEELLSRSSGEITCSEMSGLSFYSKREELNEFCEQLKRVVAELGAYEEGDFVRRSFGRLLELFGERFTRLKEKRSVLDYEDLQLMTLNLLRNHHRIRDAYRNRFREIMVDEFQDTNQLQLDLVEALRGEETTLMTVGDEMQSIYGFRHADVELFRSRRSKENVTVYHLTDNFRSLPEVVAAVNEIGLRFDSQVSSKRDGNVADRHEFGVLTTGRSDPEATGSAVTILTGRNGWKELELGALAPAIPADAEVGKDDDHFNEAEALRLAHHLRDLVDRGVARQGEIAILLRAKTRTDLYVNALKSVGLSPYLTGGKGFWNLREAVDVRSLLSVIANPLHDDMLLGALTSPACGLSADALWILRRATPPYQPLWPVLETVAGGDLPEGASADWIAAVPEADRKRTTTFVDSINRLRAKMAVTPLDVLVDEAVAETGYDLADLVRDRSRNGMANIRRVASLAHNYELAEGRDLRGFLDWVELSAGLNKEASAATQEEENDVVRIMTVHAAKGLEFKVACVPDCGRGNVSRHDGPLRLGKAPIDGDPMDFAIGLSLARPDGAKLELYEWESLKAAAKLSNEDEELRLFHVALTRAEDHLVISGAMPAKQPDGISDSLAMITRFTAAFDVDPAAPDPLPRFVPADDEPDAQIEVLGNIATEQQAAILRTEKASLEEEQPALRGRPPLSRPDTVTVPNVPLSFTALNEFEECPARFYAKRVLRLEEPGSDDPERTLAGDPAEEKLTVRDRATAFGSAVHDVFESMGNNRWPSLREESVVNALRERGADPEADLTRAVEMISGYLDSDLGRRVASGKAAFEVPLLMRIGRITIRGFADVILEEKVPMVLDYKTNRLDDKSPATKMSDYRLQRNLYALAVARSRNIDQVAAAFVFLDRPDDPVMKILGPPELESAKVELEKALQDITSGHYFGGPDAISQPCRDCWACEALASRIA